MSLKQQSIAGFKWSAIENVAVRGVQFLLGLVLARLLDPSDFGVVGLLTIFITISQTFTEGGVSNALIRKTDKSDADYSTAFYFNVAVGAVCYVILFVISPWVARFFDAGILSPLLKVLGLSVFFNSLFVVPVAKLTSEMDFKWQTIAALIAVVVSGGTGVVLAYLGYGVWALVWQTVIMAFVKGVILLVYSKWMPLLVFSRTSFKYLLSFGSKLVASNLLFTIYSQITTILIGKFYSTSDLGYYTRGRQFAGLPVDVFTGVLGKVTFPVLSRLQDNDVELIRVYRKFIRLTSLVCVFGLILLASVAKPLVIVLLTEKWTECVIYLQLFCIALLLDHITRLNLNLLQVKGRSDLYLRLEIIKRIVSIAMMLAALPFGIIYLCLSLIVYSVFAFFVNTYYTGKLFNLSCWVQLKDMAKYLLASVVACAPSLALNWLPVGNSLVQLLAGVGISVAIYWFMMRKDEQMGELIGMVKNALR
ncbi:MAG: lipopolysaccharide biosynthesis protein [Bacteroidales bacterium]|nr:lipopolysaccharide biosynthesis protein [Bacteroidales bacterium]